MSMNHDLDALLAQAEALAAQAGGQAALASSAVEDAARNARFQADSGAIAQPEDVEALRGAVAGAEQALRGGTAGDVEAAVGRLADTLFGIGFSNLPQSKPPFGEPDEPSFDPDRDDRLDEAGDPTTDPW